MTKAKGKKENRKPEAALVEAAPAQVQRTKVAIVGCSDTKNLAPYNDPSWEIWAMNNAFHVKPYSRWFEIHPIKKGPDGQFLRRKLIRPGTFEWSMEFRGQKMQDYIKSLAALDCPVYMQQHWEEIPKSIPYPVDQITGRFGRYFTNSVSYMIALAIEMGFREIGLYGVDMSTASEYGPQRPSCEFFIGICAGLGIKVTIPKQSDLLKTRFLYGFEEREQSEFEAKISSMMEAMEARKQKAAAQLEMAQKQVHQYVGAQEAVKEISRIWSNYMDKKIWSDPT